MAYTITLTDGNILLTLADQQTDSVSTSLTLIGKNVNAYGAYVNDNFVRLLENFSNTTEPTSPLQGQLWWNSVTQRMMVYTANNQFKPVSGTLVAATQPVDFGIGDLWIDTTTKQLKYTTDGITTTIAGPTYDFTQGKSGWVMESITGTNYLSNTVAGLWSNGALIGILSDTEFEIQTPWYGMTTANLGLTLSPSAKIYGTATNADAVNGLTPEDFVLYNSTTTQQIISPVWFATNTNSVIIGANEDLEFYVDPASSGTVIMNVAGYNENFNLTVNSPSTQTSVLFVDGSTPNLGIFNTSPQYPVDIIGNVQITGDLIVNGSSTYITSQVLQVTSSTIELNYSTGTSTDISGGVILYGSTSTRSIIWQPDGTGWNSSENFNLASGNSYKIGGVDVLTSSSLSSSITSAPGLTSVGTLTSLTIGQIAISTSTIGTINNVPLILGTGLTTDIDVNGNKIVNASMGDPNLWSESQVATKGYVDDVFANRLNSDQFAVTVDITDPSTRYTSIEDSRINSFIITYLENMLPPGDAAPYGIPDSSRARVMITQYSTRPYVVNSNYVDFGIPLTNVTGDISGILTTSSSVVRWNSSTVVSTNIPQLPLAINRGVKQFVVSGGFWIELIVSNNSNTVYTDGTW